MTKYKNFEELLEHCVRLHEEGKLDDPSSHFDRHPNWRDQLWKRWNLLVRSGMIQLEGTPSSDGVQSTVSKAHPTIVPGLVLGERYRLKQWIGQGGAGEVWSADDVELHRTVAIKLIYLPGAGSLAHQSFLREARLLASLEHSHIVPVYDKCATGSDIDYLVMPLMRGKSLSDWLTDNRASAPWTQTNTLARSILGVCSGLAHAHKQGIFHLDIKPANIMVGPFGEWQIADWGAAHWSAGRADPLGPQGTPEYMAPDFANGLPGAMSATTDVFGIGALMQTVLTGQPPFPGDSQRTALTQAKAGERADPNFKKAKSRVPRELIAIASKAMEPDPTMRYQRIQDVESDLRAFVDLESGAAWKDNPGQALVKWVRRYPAKALTATALILSLSLAAIAWQQKRSLDYQDEVLHIQKVHEQAYSGVRVILEESTEGLQDRYGVASIQITEHLADLGFPLAAPKEWNKRIAALRGSKIPGANSALSEVTRCVRILANCLTIAGAHRFADPSAVAAADDPKRGLTPSMAQRLAKSWQQNQSKQEQLAPLWNAVVDVAPYLNRTEWESRAWDAFLQIASGVSLTEKSALIKGLLEGADSLDPAELDWLARLRGGAGTVHLGELQSLLQKRPESAHLANIVSRLQRNYVGHLIQQRPNSAGVDLKFALRSVANAQNALSLRPDSKDAHVNLSVSLGGLVAAYATLVTQVDRIRAADNPGKGYAADLRSVFRNLAMHTRIRQIKVLRVANDRFPNHQPLTLLPQVLGRLANDWSSFYDQETQDTATRLGYTPDALQEEADELLSALGERLNYNDHWAEIGIATYRSIGSTESKASLLEKLNRDTESHTQR